MDTELTDIAGTAETRLTPDVLAQLPEQSAPAPWHGSARMLVWWSRLDPARAATVAQVLPAALRAARPLATIGALVSYKDTPVGPYDEVIAGVALRQGRAVFAHVPFIAVDSPASVVGGRANWALPKTLASFDGRPADGTTMTAAAGDWKVTATTHTRGPALPFVLPPLGKLVQVGPQGALWSVRAGITRGQARLARVTIDLTATGELTALLTPGPHAGVLLPHITLALPAATIRNA